MDTGYDMTYCVCGGPAEQRCGPCGQAGVSVRFCSTEHQRLVWPVHKLVCGPDKADLREMPQLSTGEIKQLKDMADLPAYDLIRLPPQRRMIIESRYGRPSPTLSQVLEGDEMFGPNVPLKSWLIRPAALDQNALACTRIMLYGTLGTRMNRNGAPYSLDVDPLTYVAIVKSIIGETKYGFPKDAVNATLHRALVLSSAANAVHAATKSDLSICISTATLLGTATAFLNGVIKNLTFPDYEIASIEAGCLSSPFSLPFGYKPIYIIVGEEQRISEVQLVPASA